MPNDTSAFYLWITVAVLIGGVCSLIDAYASVQAQKEEERRRAALAAQDNRPRRRRRVQQPI